MSERLKIFRTATVAGFMAGAVLQGEVFAKGKTDISGDFLPDLPYGTADFISKNVTLPDVSSRTDRPKPNAPAQFLAVCMEEAVKANAPKGSVFSHLIIPTGEKRSVQFEALLKEGDTTLGPIVSYNLDKGGPGSLYVQFVELTDPKKKTNKNHARQVSGANSISVTVPYDRDNIFGPEGEPMIRAGRDVTLLSERAAVYEAQVVMNFARACMNRMEGVQPSPDGYTYVALHAPAKFKPGG